MKRFLLPGLAVLALLALAFQGNSLVQHTLDTELPELLTRELGIPVTLGPTRARLATLTVRTPKLVMGDPADPAIVATDVTVSLDWSDLLHRQFRLRRASAADLVVNPDRWPASNAPWPADYSFLDPYLPNQLNIDSARYVTPDGNGYAVANVQWQRQATGADLSWQGDRSGTTVDIALHLDSLPELLRLSRLQLQMKAQAADADGSLVDATIDVRPGQVSGYSLTADITAAGMSARLITGNTAAWQLPSESTTHIQQLDIKRIRGLLASYGTTDTRSDPEALLAKVLPRLALPVHRGHVAIEEIRWQDEIVVDNVFDFTAGPDGLAITALTSKGPAGNLQAQAEITSSAAGWQLAASAELTAARADTSLAAAFLDADWLWRSGQATIKGEGASWGGLLNSLQGDVALTGSHRGATETPVKITARMDNRPEEFALDEILLQLGEGRITGTLAFAGDRQRRLTGNIKAQQLNLDFLLPAQTGSSGPGIPLPEFLDALPGVELAGELEIDMLEMRGLAIKKAKASLVRRPGGGHLTATVTGTSGGKLKLRMAATPVPDKPSAVSLKIDLDSIDMPKLFRQATTVIDSRTSGTISFTSQGKDVEQVFTHMRGEADLAIDIRQDHDWQRAPAPNERVRISGKTALTISDRRIAGMEISELRVDSLKQNLTGTVSMIDGRKPWLIAALESDGLDIPSLMRFRPESIAGEQESDPLAALSKLGEARFTLKARSLLLGKVPMSGVSVQLTTAPDSFSLEQFDFSVDDGKLESHGAISWKNRTATLSVDARVTNLALDKLLAGDSLDISTPVSGTITLQSSGNTLSGLLTGLSGDLQLQATGASPADTPAGARREVEMTLRNTADGAEALIRRFQWGDTDIAGSLRYYDTASPLVEVEITGGSLSLVEWEHAETGADQQKKKTDDASIVTRTARAGTDLVGDIVLAPLRLIAGPREARPGQKLFSAEPLPFDWLHKYRVKARGKLDELDSREGTAANLEFSASVMDGQLVAQASAGTLNRGSASIQLKLDATAEPIAMAVTGTFRDVHGDLIKGGYPRSGYFDVSSGGQSQAELAANIDGLVYLEFGKGPLDYQRLMLLTADVATNVFTTLIPGADKQEPELECAVALMAFKDGKGITPYGYAARTRQANLVGRVELDLRKELLHLDFSSSSRQGVGISVGNVFSNTVVVEGPLSDPQVVPNATGILWRGWAAVLTGGLSIVGESVLKRALASENPCTSVQKNIRKDLCNSGQSAASSPLVCPPA